MSASGWRVGALATGLVLVGLCLLGAGGGARAADGSPAGYDVRLYGPLAQLPAGHWAYRALEELMRAGLVVEYTPALFDEDRTITRYEAALLLVDAFRRADAVAAEARGPTRLRTLLPGRLAAAARRGEAETRRLEQTIRSLGQEFAEELKVLGFALEGASPGDLGLTASGTVRVRSQASLTLAPEPAAPEAEASGSQRPPGGEAAGPDGGAAPGEVPSPAATEPAPVPGPDQPEGLEAAASQPAGSTRAGGASLQPGAAPGPLSLASSYQLGIRLALPSRWDVDGQLDVATLAPTQLGLLVASPDPDRWLWARVGSLEPPAGASLGLGVEREPLTLQGIEARILGGDSRTGIVVGEVAPDLAAQGADSSGRALAVLDGSLILSRQVVVGGAVIRSSSDPSGLWQMGEGATVTSLTGRVAPLPWLSITGEYAQNLWALPLVAAAMRLGATLHLGDVQLGARIGRTSPDFQPAVGPARPGDEVGVDATVQLGDVRLRAGTGRRSVAAGTGQPLPELTTSLGVRIGLLTGATLAADYELISLEDLEAGRDLARTRVGVGVETPVAQVRMGLEWGDPQTLGRTSGGEAQLAASASLAYRLNPYSAVMLGYRLIDFGSEAGREAGATAQISVRF